MKQAVCLATVMTPFHLKVLKRLVDDGLIGKPVHLIVSATFKLSDADREAFMVHRTLENNFKASGFWRKPLSNSRQSRREFKELWNSIASVFDRYAAYEELDVLIFNEKSALAQIAIYEMQRRRSVGKIMAADEGLAYYIEDGLSVKVKQLLYPLLTRALLGFAYQYFRRAGVHKAIDTIYLRYPDLIDRKRKRYVEFRVSEQKQTFNPDSNKALLLTSPFSEFGVLSAEKEARGVRVVIDCLKASGYEVVIKPHPHERTDKYSGLQCPRVSLSPGEIIIEDTDLEPYHCIVHFGSSAVIDVLDRGFPRQNIITYKVTKIDSPFFEKLKIARNAEEMAASLRSASGQSRH